MILPAFVSTMKNGFHGLQIRYRQWIFSFPQDSHALHSYKVVCLCHCLSQDMKLKVNVKVWKRRLISKQIHQIRRHDVPKFFYLGVGSKLDLFVVSDNRRWPFFHVYWPIHETQCFHLQCIDESVFSFTGNFALCICSRARTCSGFTNHYLFTLNLYYENCGAYGKSGNPESGNPLLCVVTPITNSNFYMCYSHFNQFPGVVPTWKHKQICFV